MNRSKRIVLASFLFGVAAGAAFVPRSIGGNALAEPGPAPAPSPDPVLRAENEGAAQDQGRMTEETLAREANSRVTPVVRAVQVAGPSVVNIQVGFLREDGSRRVFQKAGEGSGVIVDEEGLVISNWHVVRIHDEPSFYCRVSLRDGKTYPARVLSTSRENDLALLLIETKPSEKVRFQPIGLADSDQLMVGETVIAIGNPQGQANSVTSGVLSATNRSLRVVPPGERQPIDFDGLLQTDAAINPGNSGGALLDITGRLIGINTLMQKMSENIGFAIPVNRVKEVFQTNLLRYDKIDRFWTGLRVDEGQGGVEVVGVVEDSPAWRAGLRRGDLIAGIGDKDVGDLQDFVRALIRCEPEQEIALRVRQAAGERAVRLVPWAREKTRIFLRAGLFVGALRYETDTKLLRDAHEAFYGRERYWNVQIDPVRVEDLQRGGPADTLGLSDGDLIVGFKQKDPWTGYERRVPLTGGVAQFAEILEHFAGQSLHVLVYRPGKPLQSGPLDVR